MVLGPKDPLKKLLPILRHGRKMVESWRPVWFFLFLSDFFAFCGAGHEKIGCYEWFMFVYVWFVRAGEFFDLVWFVGRLNDWLMRSKNEGWCFHLISVAVMVKRSFLCIILLQQKQNHVKKKTL